MHKRFIYFAASLLTLTLIYLVAVLFIRGKSIPANDAPIFADKGTRLEVKGITSKDVEALKLSGINMGNFGEPPQDAIWITDQEVMENFLSALKNATTRSHLRTGDGVDTLEIVFKARGKFRRPALSFSYNALRTEMWYGSSFKKALIYLGTFQAEQVRKQFLHVNPRQIKMIELESIKISDSLKVDASFFAYTSRSKADPMKYFSDFKVRWINGTVARIHFVPSRSVIKGPLKELGSLY
jgi:hypothetical protein